MTHGVQATQEKRGCGWTTACQMSKRSPQFTTNISRSRAPLGLTSAWETPWAQGLTEAVKTNSKRFDPTPTRSKPDVSDKVEPPRLESKNTEPRGGIPRTYACLPSSGPPGKRQCPGISGKAASERAPSVARSHQAVRSTTGFHIPNRPGRARVAVFPPGCQPR